MADLTHPWTEYARPFKIIDNLYFVGTVGASSHLIVTKEGLILLDTGYPQTLYLLIDSISRLGFDIRDITHIVHTHGHYDHLGATKALSALSCAKTWIGAADKTYANGEVNLTWANELGCVYNEAFEPDYLLLDGDVMTFGDISIKAVGTPGHTPGTMSFFFDMPHQNQMLKVGMHGGVGTNSMTGAFLAQYDLPLSCRQDFFDGLERLSKIKVDVYLGNHTWNNDTIGKSNRMSASNNPFLDSHTWQPFLTACKNSLQQVIASEK